ncbi:3-isopropylmalate dehydrogenase [Staphylococcus sp. SQ8-PEA]|uniref:3-isopropylmalate dehydrogenase n=1 Tax=Staphylococcus marylandisciuri TaxID=2981529 RepID=A0ABT2QQA3_9STAP|nr:3-isopropylmalate dehydrogenase [Staphylococcus marylandisciuri]MCU5746142.1 3-isopropylmalate dehydrogenase [Staphylococcus marylandisciuri]
MSYHIVTLPGDGIGPEIMSGTVKVLKHLSNRFQFSYTLKSYDIGGIAIDKHNDPLPERTLNACHSADAILLGAVGGPQWTDASIRPEQGLLQLRKELNLFANIRPTTVTHETSHLSPIKEERVKNTNFVIVRELTSGLYFGEPKYFNDDKALDSLTYTKEEITRIAHVAFQLAQTRNRKLTSVDKENVLASSKLWRSVINEVGQSYPDVELEHLLVDACAMHLVTHPSRFDVILTENMFGDILSDEASVIPGSLGLSPSASFGSNGPKLYEPIHGSAPDIANQNIANPFGMLLSLAMCLRESFNETAAASHLETSIFKLIKEKKTTRDLGGKYTTDEVINHLLEYI